MTPFKYGMNPHENARHRFASDGVVCGGSLSLNAYFDLDVGYRVAGDDPGRLVYAKHGLPLFSVDTTAPDWEAALDRCFELNRDRDFGGFTYSGVLTPELVARLQGLRHHTISSPAAAPEALALLADGPVQDRNRGVTAAIGISPLPAARTYTIQAGEASVSFNRGYDDPGGAEGILRRMVNCGRTLTAAVHSGPHVLYANSGFTDPLQLLAVSLAPFTDEAGPDLVVATDACFSVKDPTPFVTRANVSELWLFGTKKEHDDVAVRLEREGIRTVLVPERAFSYVP